MLRHYTGRHNVVFLGVPTDGSRRMGREGGHPKGFNDSIGWPPIAFKVTNGSLSNTRDQEKKQEGQHYLTIQYNTKEKLVIRVQSKDDQDVMSCHQ